MGFRVLGGFSLLIIIIIIYLINLASSHPVPKTFPSEFVQKLEDKIIYGSKIKGGASGGASGGVNGGVHGGSSHGNGNSGSSAARGGAAVIPVYAAGAAGRNRQHQIHHGAANCNINFKLSNMLMIILVYPLILSFLLM